MNESGEPVREKAGGVVKRAIGLLVIAALTLAPFGSLGAVLEPRAVLAEHFRYDELPFELEPVAAAKLPQSARVIRLAHPDHADREPDPELEREFEEPEPEVEDQASREKGSGSDREGRGGRGSGGGGLWTPPDIDFVESAPPTEVFFVISDSPQGALSTFAGTGGSGGGGGRGRGGGRGGWGGGFDPSSPIAMGGGDLDWKSTRVGYRHERRYEGEAAHDEVRVNLSREGFYCVMVVRWPEDHAASVERVEELLAAFDEA